MLRILIARELLLAAMPLFAAALLAFPSAARAQYPGHIDTTKPAKGSTLRAIAVLEWTGPSGKPTASRLIPITVFDGDHLHDGTLYLSRPAPLALESGNEYELQTAGQPIGLYDLHSAGHNQLGGLDSWQGYGAWRPLPKPAPPGLNTSSLHITGLNEDEPVLLRKHPKGSDQNDARTSNQTGTKSGTATSGGSGPVDPNRPTLRRQTDSAASANDSTATAPSATAPGGTGPVDPDRPTLHHLPPAAANSATTTPGDQPLRETGLNSPDPNRPRLSYGKPKNLARAAEELQGAPPAMHQLVAVSDPAASAPHPWTYSWPSPFDQANARRALEAIARAALTPPTKPSPAKPLRPGTASRKSSTTPTAVTPLTPPARLGHESFRSFELEYGAAPTMVFSASTPPPDETNSDASGQPNTQPTPPQRFVTVIAQPDLYGNPIVLKKIVTDSAHLDETPRPRLIDAVDAKGDNRAELLFELLGDHQRSFALYAVINGSVEPIFTTIPIP